MYNMLENMFNMICNMSLMPKTVEYAEAYVPYQQYTKSYNPQEALEKGTMFPELYRPYNKSGYRRDFECIE